MRSSNVEWLRICLLLQLFSVACRGPKNRIDDGALFFLSDFNRFENGGVFRGLGDEYLVKAQPQKIAKVDIYVSASERSNPEIEQNEVSQNTVKKFERECTIDGLKRGLGKRVRNDCVSEVFLSSPTSQRGESNSASRGPRHDDSYRGIMLARPTE